MLLGYAQQHSLEIYRFLNLEKESIITSCDVRWLNMSYPQWIRKGSGEVIHWADPVAIDIVDGNDEEDTPQLTTPETGN